ncbi:MAG: glutathione S-transferase family protein [Pseudoruegeria sp.]
MPEIEPKDLSLKTMKGIHLWHAPLSSCSQRVRITLAETGRTFESHLVDLEAGEHASEAFQRIHPNGVVPALVEDGRLYIESIDIIRHLARAHTALSIGDADLLALADGAQVDLKLLTFEFLFRGASPPTEEAAKAFQRNHKNAKLKQFHRDFEAGFTKERLDHAVRRTAAAFNVLDARLADGRPYLSGDQFSLTDIAWMPNAHRFSLMGWPFQQTPYLAVWFDQIRQRNSYKTALMDWQSEDVAGLFKSYTDARQTEGRDIHHYGGLS